MKVVHWGRAREFFKRHKNARTPLTQWRIAVQAVTWNNFADVRSNFGDADWVDGKIVFNIKGNDYRLIAIAVFANGALYIRHVMTYEEYDKGIWQNAPSKKVKKQRTELQSCQSQ